MPPSAREDDSRNSPVRVRPFEPTDAAQVQSLIVQIQRNEFQIPITLEEQPDLFDIERVYCTHRTGQGVGQFWVALDEERVVGTIALFDLNPGQSMGQTALRKMFVAPGHRGSPHRAGQRLLDALLSHARAHGVKEIALGTTHAFHAAHRFYEKNGFEPIPKEQLPANWPHNKVDVKFYRRTI